MAKYLPALIILVFSLIGLKAFFSPGLFTAHDIWHQVARLYYYFQALNNGQIPPYWISTLSNGYGYPLFTFSYHLPWILGFPLLKIGLNFTLVIKILFFLAYFFSGISMYLFTNYIFKNKLASLLSAILYLFVPYHFLTILVAASMGVVFVFIFLPLILLSIYQIFKGRRWGIPILALSISGLILSHALHIFYVLPLCILFTLLILIANKKKTVFTRNILFALVLSLLLSAFYLIPATYYSQFTRVRIERGIDNLYKSNFIDFKQLVYSKWGYGPVVENAKEGSVSFQLGIAQWLSILGIIILLIFNKIKQRSLSIFILSGFIISVLATLDLSRPLWEFFQKFIVLDYPFRFLLPAVFLSSMASGLALVNLKKKFQIVFFILLLSIVLYTNRNHININMSTNIPLVDYLASETTTNTFNEYLPIEADDKFVKEKGNVIAPANLEVSDYKQDTKGISLGLNPNKEVDIAIGQYYFPGQTLYIDNKKTDIKVDPQGRVSFSLSPGTHHILVQFEETSVIKISKYLTLLGVLLLIAYLKFIE